MVAGALPDGLAVTWLSPLLLAVTWLSPLLALPDALLLMMVAIVVALPRVSRLAPWPSRLRAAVSLRLV